MERVIAELYRWLEKNNLPTEGVELHVVMPTRRAAGDASSTLKLELSPSVTFPYSGTDRRPRIMDMPVEFSEPPSHP